MEHEKTLEFPDGMTPFHPEHPGWELSDDGDGKYVTSVYEMDYGSITAEESRFCLWLGTWLHSYDSDEALATKALGQVEGFTQSEMFQQYYDPHSAKPYVLEILEKMQLGDPAEAHHYYNVGCERFHDQIPLP